MPEISVEQLERLRRGLDLANVHPMRFHFLNPLETVKEVVDSNTTRTVTDDGIDVFRAFFGRAYESDEEVLHAAAEAGLINPKYVDESIRGDDD